MDERPLVVVHPPSSTGGRRVTVRAETLGTAYEPGDIVEFLSLAGLDPDPVWFDDPALLEWRGGGRDVWA
ncbi:MULTISPECIES: hypothetical protein [unclassified Streptomyces]|uniref:hypothetical protein n=1 Tax=unclassified Streptomyces TaxID=2593676 RepID=UPI000C27C454|nr:hypothetical protein [Streptomyces sp. CB02959]PJN40782.1 hypothetical protein CG747_10630 [Streptomyces sp. CB02959]